MKYQKNFVLTLTILLVLSTLAISFASVSGAVTIPEAVDNTELTWSTGGNAGWFGQTSTYYYDGDAAESGDITSSETTYLETTVDSGGDLSFYWKASSEGSFDFLRFYIDGSKQAEISGSTSWSQKTYQLGSGSHTLRWVYEKDGSFSSGSDCGWVDKVVFTPPEKEPNAPTDPSPVDGTVGVSVNPTLSVNVSHPDGDPMDVYFYDASDDTLIGNETAVLSGGTASVTWSSLTRGVIYSWYTVADSGLINRSETWSFTTITIPEAVDNTELSWSTGGNADWFGQTSTSYHDGDAAESGDITSSQTTYVETSVSSGGDLTFYWKVDSEGSFDFLRFYIDGSKQAEISGSTSWAQKSYNLGSGSHTFRWAYEKDDSYSVGSDCGWIDWVGFTPENNPPDEPTGSSPSDGATGINTSTTLSVDVSDPDGDSMDVSFYDASDDSLIGTDTGVPNGGTASITWSGLTEASEYNWYAGADDGELTNQSVAWSFTTLMNIELLKDQDSNGWNFVSFNLTLEDTSLTSILDDPVDGITGNYDKVMWYDAENDEWLSYMPDRDDRFNDLDKWNHSMGVWIRMNDTADTTLIIRGNRPTSTDIILRSGWNMVGYPSSYSGNNGLPSEVSKIGHFDANETYNLAYDYDPQLFTFNPSEAYLIYNEANYFVTWNVDN